VSEIGYEKENGSKLEISRANSSLQRTNKKNESLQRRKGRQGNWSWVFSFQVQFSASSAIALGRWGFFFSHYYTASDHWLIAVVASIPSPALTRAHTEIHTEIHIETENTRKIIWLLDTYF
jgi:hypothetical protein